MKKLKKIIIVFASFALLYIAAIFSIEFYIEKQLEQQENLSYTDFKMSFAGDIDFENLQFKNEKFEVKAETVSLSIGILKILTSDTILIKKSIVKNAKLNHLKIDSTLTKKREKQLDQPFALQKVIIEGLDYYALNRDSLGHSDTTTRLLAVDLQANIENLKDLQFSQLESLNIKFLQQNAGDLHDIKIDHIAYKNNQIKIDSFKVKTRYSKQEYTNQIKYQKDHIDLVAHNLKIDSLEVLLEKNKLAKVSMGEILVDSFLLQVYRDKTIPVNPKHKPTYAELMQNLNFKVDGRVLETKHSCIKYSMKNEDRQISSIDLNEINARLINITNTQKEDNKANLKGTFSVSDGSMIALNLTYDQFAKVETFQLDAEAKDVETHALNSMLLPSLNIKLQGYINKLKTRMYCYGIANGTFMIQSQNIDLDVYNEKREKRKIISFIASKLLNPPIEKSSKIEDFQRDRTKGIWGNIWQFVLVGLKNAVL